MLISSELTLGRNRWFGLELRRPHWRLLSLLGFLHNPAIKAAATCQPMSLGEGNRNLTGIASAGSADAHV